MLSESLNALWFIIYIVVSEYVIDIFNIYNTEALHLHRTYPEQQEYCVRQLPDISGDICLDYISTWRQEYFVSGIYNF